MYQLDMETFRAIHVGWHSVLLDPFFWLLSTSGVGWVQGLGIVIFLRWEKTKRYVFPLLITLIVSGLPVAQGVKRLLISRDRPSNWRIAVPQEEIWANSFPSGHTTTSFAIAAMLLLMTWGSRNQKLGRWAALWAVLVGISRVYRGVHWPTDVLAGACAGIFSACLVYLVLRKLGHELHLDQAANTISGQEVER